VGQELAAGRLPGPGTPRSVGVAAGSLLVGKALRTAPAAIGNPLMVGRMRGSTRTADTYRF